MPPFSSKKPCIFNFKIDNTENFLGKIKGAQRLFSVNLRVRGRYKFKLCKHHYSLIKEELK